MATEQGIEEMITLLEGYVQQFYPPALAPLDWKAPKTVKVRGLDITKAELTKMLSDYKKQLSELKKTKTAPEVTSGTTSTTVPTTSRSEGFVPDSAPQTSTGTSKTKYPEYENLIGLETSYKVFIDIQNRLQKIKTGIKNGYIDLTEDEAKQRNVPYPYRFQLPQFSDEYNNLIEEQKNLRSRAAYLVPILKKIAKEYVPLSGAENTTPEKEASKIIKYIADIPKPTIVQPKVDSSFGPQLSNTAAGDPATTVKSKVTVVKDGNNVEVTTYMDGRISEKVLGPSTLPDTATSNLPKDTSGSPAAIKTYVDEQLVAKGLADTPANRKTLRAEYQISRAAATTDSSWEQIFIQNNPAKAWYLTDLDRAKYPQLFAVLKQYALPRPLTVEEQSAFAAKLDGTDFFQELSTSGKVREIKKVVGDLGFDGSDFTKFVHTAINMGYTDERLKQETYKEVFKIGADGKYVNPTALARATKSADYLNVVNTARSYFNTAGANQASVQSVLTGGITTEDFQRQQREIAKKRYPHLADLIDQGVSLESLAGNFQATAAKLLEVDPNTIDMSAANYEVALNFGEEGKKRVMTTGEWDKLLRTDSRYGWEKTNNAKQEARGLAANLVQAFGRII